MGKPKWFRVNITIDIVIKASTVLWLLHWIAWTLLIVNYVLTGSHGHPPVF